MKILLQLEMVMEIQIWKQSQESSLRENREDPVLPLRHTS